jgi:ppGpp synthetase/RelA/SpoT-type nucleotidyltranferase
MNEAPLIEEYRQRHETILKPLAGKLTAFIQDMVSGIPRVDRVAARAKSPDRFLGKTKKRGDDGGLKYAHPFEQIQDLIGARIIVFYKQDVEAVCEIVERYFRHIENKVLAPDEADKFGYVGMHYILAIPEDVIEDAADRDKTPQFFELQIKTLFQHAWSEAEHDVGYKPSDTISTHQKRQLAFTAAQAWGADHIFAQLHHELNGAKPHVGQ